MVLGPLDRSAPWRTAGEMLSRAVRHERDLQRTQAAVLAGWTTDSPAAQSWLGRGRLAAEVPRGGAAAVRRIEPPLKTCRGTPTPAWMPDNRHVVVSVQPTPDGSEQLWLVDTQSSERHALTSSTRNASSPSVAFWRRQAGVSRDQWQLRRRLGGSGNWSRNDGRRHRTGRTHAGMGRRRAHDGVWQQPQWARRDLASAQWCSRPPGRHRAGVPRRRYAAFHGPHSRREAIAHYGVRIEGRAGQGCGFRRLRAERRYGRRTIQKPALSFPGPGHLTARGSVHIAVVDGNVNLMKVKTSGEAAPVTIKANVSRRVGLTGHRLVMDRVRQSADVPGRQDRTAARFTRIAALRLFEGWQAGLRNGARKRAAHAVLDRRRYRGEAQNRLGDQLRTANESLALDAVESRP